MNPESATAVAPGNATPLRPVEPTRCIGGLALVYACPKCTKQCALSDPRAVSAFVARNDVGMDCPSCGAALRIGHKDQPRILAPGVGGNRHQRRAAAAMGLIK